MQGPVLPAGAFVPWALRFVFLKRRRAFTSPGAGSPGPWWHRRPAPRCARPGAAAAAGTRGAEQTRPALAQSHTPQESTQTW